jgi:hypothetical protein
MRHPDGRGTTVPVHGNRDLAKGTLRGILSDVGVTIEELATANPSCLMSPFCFPLIKNAPMLFCAPDIVFIITGSPITPRRRSEIRLTMMAERSFERTAPALLVKLTRARRAKGLPLMLGAG